MINRLAAHRLMIHRTWMRRVALVATLGLAACSSAPLHYYTLVPPATESASAPTADFVFELLPVGIPSQVDQPQLVVRSGGQGMQMLDSERWIAPLADEMRGALSADLSRILHAKDVSGLPVGKLPVLLIKVDVRRFDSAPGSYALIDAAWSAHTSQGTATMACTSQLSQPVGAGYDALVQAHQQLLDQLAGQIAASARGLVPGRESTDPGAGSCNEHPPKA